MPSAEGFRVDSCLIRSALLLCATMGGTAWSSVVIDRTELLATGMGEMSIEVDVSPQQSHLSVEAAVASAVKPAAAGLNHGGDLRAAGTDVSVSASGTWDFGWELMRKQPTTASGPVTRDVPVPPAALLFATALAGFIAVTRRNSIDK